MVLYLGRKPHIAAKLCCRPPHAGGGFALFYPVRLPISGIIYKSKAGCCQPPGGLPYHPFQHSSHKLDSIFALTRSPLPLGIPPRGTFMPGRPRAPLPLAAASPQKPTGGQPTEAWMCQYRRSPLQGTWRWRKTCIQPRPGSWMLPMYWRHSPLVGCAITGSGKWLQARSHSGSSRSSQPEHVACSCFKVGGSMVPLSGEQPIRRSVLFHPLYCVVTPTITIESSLPIT